MTREPGKPVQKLQIYETLHSLNQGFEQVLADLRRVQRLPFSRRQPFRVLPIVVEETRAWANFALAAVMQDRELGDWTRFGRLRRRWEKRYLDANDGPTVAGGPKWKGSKATGKRRTKGGKGEGHV